jgi:hypothetical protein
MFSRIEKELLDIPQYDKKNGAIALILSTLLDGIGVLIMGFIDPNKDVKILSIILFALSFAFGLGWLLAVIWSVVALVKAL